MSVELPIFTETAHCHLRRDGYASCKSCRMSRSWRGQLRQNFRLPNDDVDFDCPHGKGPVVDAVRARSRGLGDTIEKFTKMIGIRPCRKCKNRQKKLNQLFPYKQKGE